MDVNFYYLFITLGMTIVFSFMPEKYLRPSPSKFGFKHANRSLILQCLLVTILFLFVTLIVQRLVFASLAVSIFLIILSGVSNAKYQALREPLVYSDIAMFSQAFKHPRLYFPFLGLIAVIVMPLIIIVLITGLLILEPAMEFTWQRIIISLIAIAFLFIAAKKLVMQFELSEDPAIDNQQYGLLNSVVVYYFQSRGDQHKQQIRDVLNKSPFSMSGNFRTMLQHSPASPYGNISTTSLVPRETNKAPHFYEFSPKTTLHNITIIQSESFFDARRLDQSVNNNVLENYDQCLTESSQFGKLNVPAWGANTMRTEFSFLTGLKYEDMGLYRYYPYQYLHKMPIVSLAKLLQVQGYHCVCIHPHPASFFGRDRIFPKMGFDEFIDIESFDTSATFGPYISDQAVTDKILEINNKYHSKPLFIFAITMENHGPLHLEKTTKDEQQQYFSKAPFDDINDLTVYLRHLKNADQMVQQLTSAYQKIEAPTTLCFYGDHIPSMPKTYEKLAYEDRDSDYFIWNNQIKKQRSKQEDLSVDSLAKIVLKITGNIE